MTSVLLGFKDRFAAFGVVKACKQTNECSLPACGHIHPPPHGLVSTVTSCLNLAGATSSTCHDLNNYILPQRVQGDPGRRAGRLPLCTRHALDCGELADNFVCHACADPKDLDVWTKPPPNATDGIDWAWPRRLFVCSGAGPHCSADVRMWVVLMLILCYVMSSFLCSCYVMLCYAYVRMCVVLMLLQLRGLLPYWHVIVLEFSSFCKSFFLMLRGWPSHISPQTLNQAMTRLDVGLTHFKPQSKQRPCLRLFLTPTVLSQSDL